MAAFSLSNCNIFAPPRPSPTFFFEDSRFLLQPLFRLHQPHHHRARNYRLSFPLSHSSSASVGSRSFTSYLALAAQDTAATTKKEEEDGQDDEIAAEIGGGQHASQLENFIKGYKKAFLDGDQKAVYEIQRKILMIENEKNELFQKLYNLSGEITSGKEKCVRLQADFDNFRKRSEKEKLNIRTDYQEEVIESLLAVVDSFERAKQQIKPETEKEKNIDGSYQGIYKQFVEVMRSLHVAVVPTVGKPFDPSVHEAIAREESQEFKEGIIIQEFRRGFLLGDRLLRPATVKVSSGPGRKNNPVATSNSSEQPAAS